MTGRAAIEDPLKEFRFRVYIDDFARSGFTEVTGIEEETEAAEYQEGGTDTPQKSASKTKYNDVTLKRGQIVGSTAGGDDDFLKWRRLVKKLTAEGTAENYRKTVEVVQFNSMNQPVRRWRLVQGWPSKLKPFSDLKGDGTGNSYEEITLKHEGLEEVPV